jgi:hypothetical protein
MYSVVRHDFLRVIFSTAAQRDLEMLQLDVTTAFLNWDLKEELYMEQQTGFETVAVHSREINEYALSISNFNRFYF